MATVTVPFNGVEDELLVLKSFGIKVTGLGLGGGGNTEATLEGKESVIREYLAHIWGLHADSDEINELFEDQEQS